MIAKLRITSRVTGPEKEHGMREIPSLLSAAITGGIFVTLILMELRRPLRKGKHESKLRRNVRNAAVAGTSAAAVMLTSAPVTVPLTKLVERKKIGLLKWCGMPAWLETSVALLLLDYTLYLWHVAFHKTQLLWRFHQVHHVDLDMDTSTALRFHFGEMVMSTVLQTFQILTIGVSPRTFSIWNTWLVSEVMFHHSNVELPYRIERWLSKVIVTPRMHGIHHSIVPEELNSNWSSGLTMWDWLHGTLRLNIPQDKITIGVAAYPEASDLTYPKLMQMPFGEQHTPWIRPDGTAPRREESLSGTPTILAPESTMAASGENASRVLPASRHS